MAEALRRVGRYEISEVIGRGGTAVVYLATQTDLNREVALKELSPHHAGDARFAERFVEESRLIGAMNHPNIVTVHEFFEDDGLPYIAMEYLPRGSLRPHLRTLTPAQIFGVAENVLAGLAHGETHHTIHRDLKPENLLVTADGQVKIADYGVARALNPVVPRPFQTMTGTTIGTPAYMAPEQALGEPLGPQADLYSLGIILWEALVGHPPFQSEDTPMAVLYRHIHDPVPAISALVPGVDPALTRWLDVILAKAPEHRFAGAAEAWDDLEDVAISLLGPRWRREARIDLAVDPAELEITPPRGSGQISATRTDLPARHDAGSATAPSASTPSRPTPTPTAWSVTPDSAAAAPGKAPVGRPVPTPETVESADGAAAGHETLMGCSRRHVESDAGPEPDVVARRRWPLAVATGLAAVVAAGAGIGVGLGTNQGSPTRVTRTQTTPAGGLAADVRPVLASLANAQHGDLHRLNRARTAAAQASGARALAADYHGAKLKLTRLPRAERHLRAARTLTRAVSAVERDWSRARQAALATNSHRYANARSAITRDTVALAGAGARADGAATG